MHTRALRTACYAHSSAADGVPDERTLHAGEPTSHEKWVAQLWLHERPYTPNVPAGSSHDEAASRIAHIAAEHGLELGQPAVR